jgi:hypothetical protein
MNIQLQETHAGKLIVTISKIDNGFVTTLIEPPPGPKQKPPTEGEINKKITEMVQGIIGFNKTMNQLSGPHGPDESWRGGEGHVDLPQMVEHFKAMNPSIVEEMREQMCPPQPRIERMVFTELKDLLNYIASNMTENR